MNALGDPTSTRNVGAFVIKSYDVTTLKNMGQKKSPQTLAQLLALPGMGLMDEGEALGYFNGATTFEIAFEQDKPVAVHIVGETEDRESFDVIRPEAHPAFSAGAGGRRRRSRLHKQARRTKRHGRNLKHRKFRKLSTRRR